MTPQDHSTTNEASLQDTLAAARAIDTSQAGQMNQPANPRLEESNEPTRSSGGLSSLTDSVGNIVREYPGPSIFLGAGLAWLLVSREQKRNRSLPIRLRDSARDARLRLRESREHTMESLEHAKLSAAERLDSAKIHASERLDSAKHTASDRIDSAKLSAEHGAEYVKNAYEHTLDENPLVLGACAVAAGLALGLLLPPTQKENELMGGVRDGLLDQARGIVDEARQAAVRTLHSGTDSVKEHLIEAKEEMKESVVESLKDAKTAAQDEISKSTPPSSNDRLR